MPPRRKLPAAPLPRAAPSPRCAALGGGGALLRATCALPPGWAVNPVTLRSERRRDGGGAAGAHGSPHCGTQEPGDLERRWEGVYLALDDARRAGDSAALLRMLPEAERILT
eukprot:gene18009-15515_t